MENIGYFGGSLALVSHFSLELNFWGDVW